MTITEINFKKMNTAFQELAKELSTVVNKHTVKPGAYQSEESEPFNDKHAYQFHYGPYDIKFKKVGNGTLKIDIAGDFSSKLNLQEIRTAYQDILNHAASFLKKENINVYVSLSFYRFTEDGINLHEYFGPYNFADFEDIHIATPLSDELKDLQETTLELKKHFPIKHNGKVIESGEGKFRKMHQLDVVNEDGIAKIGIFHDDELLLTVATKADVHRLVALKKSKLDELQKIKDEAIKTLRTHDSTFAYDGKTGVVLFGQKATINTEFDVFKNEYLMIFLKSRVKATAIHTIQEKIDKLIIKKTS